MHLVGYGSRWLLIAMLLLGPLTSARRRPSGSRPGESASRRACVAKSCRDLPSSVQRSSWWRSRSRPCCISTSTATRSTTTCSAPASGRHGEESPFPRECRSSCNARTGNISISRDRRFSARPETSASSKRTTSRSGTHVALGYVGSLLVLDVLLSRLRAPLLWRRVGVLAAACGGIVNWTGWAAKNDLGAVLWALGGLAVLEESPILGFALLGFAVAAKVSSIIFVAPMLAAWLWQATRKPEDRARLARVIPWAAAAGIAATLDLRAQLALARQSDLSVGAPALWHSVGGTLFQRRHRSDRAVVGHFPRPSARASGALQQRIHPHASPPITAVGALLSRRRDSRRAVWWLALAGVFVLHRVATRARTTTA